MFNCNLKEFLRHFVTVDETQINHYTPEMKEYSKFHPTKLFQRRCEWFHQPKKSWRPFFGIHKQLSLLTIWRKKKLSHLAKKVLFLNDNEPVYMSLISTKKLLEIRYGLLPHPPYSPDLASCDFFLFPTEASLAHVASVYNHYPKPSSKHVYERSPCAPCTIVKTAYSFQT